MKNELGIFIRLTAAVKEIESHGDIIKWQLEQYKLAQPDIDDIKTNYKLVVYLDGFDEIWDNYLGTRRKAFLDKSAFYRLKFDMKKMKCVFVSCRPEIMFNEEFDEIFEVKEKAFDEIVIDSLTFSGRKKYIELFAENNELNEYSWTDKRLASGLSQVSALESKLFDTPLLLQLYNCDAAII